MFLITHIIIALSSIALTTLAYATPSKNKLRASYGLAALTLGTGTWLVISMQSALLHACMTGLLYLAVVSVGIIATRQKLKQYN
jgi:hypothetical protein